MFENPLTREILIVLVIKLTALVVIFQLFFAAAHRPDIDPAITATRLLGVQTADREAP